MSTDQPPRCKYFNLTYPLPFVAHVEINRPEKLNAFIEEMWLEMPPLFAFLSASPDVRTVILSGTGSKAFTAGLDIQAASQTLAPMPQLPSPSPSSPSHPSSANDPPSPPDPARKAAHLRTHISTFQSCISALSTCAKPIVAAIHGHCLGLGIDIACACDVRICTPNARFAVKEVDVGLAADIGTLSRLPKVVGNGSWVKDVCLSARVFGAREAREVGFVSWVGGGDDGAAGSSGQDGGRGGGDVGKEEVLREAIRWAALVAQKSPVAVQGTKEILNWSWDRSVEDGLRYTTVWNSVALQSGDVSEAMVAGLERRKGRFSKL